MKNNASSVLFRRMPYYLSPQFDIYEKLRGWIGKEDDPFGVILEVGFGTGLGTFQYSKCVTQIDAIEIDPAAVRFAQRCLPIDNVNWIESDINDAEWLGRKYLYDFVVMIEVLEHIEFANIALSRVVSVLRPEARALITVPNKNRERKKDDPLIEREWDTEEFFTELLGHFDEVWFLDYELREIVGTPDTTATPLIALCSLAS